MRIEISKEEKHQLAAKVRNAQPLSAIEMAVAAQLIEGENGALEPKPVEKVIEKPVFFRAKAKAMHKWHKRDWAGLLDKACDICDKRKSPIAAFRLAKKLGLPYVGGTYSHFCKALQSDKRLTVEIDKHDSRLLIVTTAPTKLAKHERPMGEYKVNGYHQFLKQRTPFYIKQGMNSWEAIRMAQADYAKLKGRAPDMKVVYEFPEMESIRADLIPIFRDMLVDMYKRGNAINYTDVSYALDLTSRKDYEKFLTEVLAKSERIAKALNIPKKLVVSNQRDISWA